ncbi:MAG: hypothetical protein Q7S89_01205 [bacterium]|nr:hypothetical protein [bacterium]
MSSLIRRFILVIQSALFFSIASAAHAVEAPFRFFGSLQRAGRNAFSIGYTDVVHSATASGRNPIIFMAVLILNKLLGFLSIILLVLVLYAGFTWMTARGEEEKVEEAKQTIARAIIGLVIVVVSWAISSYIVSTLLQVTSPDLQ